MLMLPETPSAWNVARPAEAMLPPDPPLATITIHTESIMLRTHGVASSVRMVSAHDLARALTSEMTLHSGLMPREALWWSSTSRGTCVAMFQEARVWKVALQLSLKDPAERFSLPMPPLVFIHTPAGAPYVFAVKRRPRSDSDEVYHTPTFNVFESGRVCAGSHKFPDDPEQTAGHFFTSFFSQEGGAHARSQQHPRVIDLWKDLDGKDRYPLPDLVRAGTVKGAMELRP